MRFGRAERSSEPPQERGLAALGDDEFERA
jgi:hypothetical protein